jgi:hypothetical protein
MKWNSVEWINRLKTSVCNIISGVLFDIIKEEQWSRFTMIKMLIKRF